MGYLDVEGHVNLVRDEQSGAILNTDSSQYNQYMALRNSKAKKDQKIVLLVGDIGYGIFDDFRKQHPKRFFNHIQKDFLIDVWV